MENLIYLSITLLFCYVIGNKFDKITRFLIELWGFLTYKVAINNKKYGGELVAAVLKAHGVENIFTLTGGHISPILVAAKAAGIRIIDTRDEATAAFAADSYARLSGKIGVVAVTAGPGVTNTITAVKTAEMIEAPVLILGGAAPTLLKGRGALQDMDHITLLKSICKYSTSIQYVRHIIPTLKKAIQIAMSGTPGPVFVEIPVDVLYPFEIVKKEVDQKKVAKGIFAFLYNLYCRWYLSNLFGKGFDNTNVEPLPVHLDFAANCYVEQCKNLLCKAKKPVLLLGGQTVTPVKYIKDLKVAIDRLNIPCFVSGPARGLLGKEHKLLIRQGRKEALKNADLVILAGTICDFRLSYGRAFSRRTTIVAINTNKKKLKMNSFIFYNLHLGILGNVPDFLIRLANSLTDNDISHLNYSSWIQTLQEKSLMVENSNRKKAEEKLPANLNPLHLLYQLDDMLGNNTILVADGGDFVATASYILRPRGPLMWLDPGPFGTLGSGAGYALGAKVYNPSADVVILYGDGAAGFSLIEFDTFARHQLPVLAIIGNDACWRQIEREQVGIFEDDIACALSFARYHDVASAFNATGILLDEHNAHKLQEVLQNAIDSYHYHKSVLINAHIGKVDFRAGSISV